MKRSGHGSVVIQVTVLVLCLFVSGCFPLTEELLDREPEGYFTTISDIYLIEKDNKQFKAFQFREHYYVTDARYQFCEVLASELTSMVHKKYNGKVRVLYDDDEQTVGSAEFFIKPGEDQALIEQITKLWFRYEEKTDSYVKFFGFYGQRYKGTLQEKDLLCHLTLPIETSISVIGGTDYHKLPLAPFTLVGDLAIVVTAIVWFPFVNDSGWKN